jgi:hypothetical protein
MLPTCVRDFETRLSTTYVLFSPKFEKESLEEFVTYSPETAMATRTIDVNDQL